jgi:hypothetical protein
MKKFGKECFIEDHCKAERHQAYCLEAEVEEFLKWGELVEKN